MFRRAPLSMTQRPATVSFGSWEVQKGLAKRPVHVEQGDPLSSLEPDRAKLEEQLLDAAKALVNRPRKT